MLEPYGGRVRCVVPVDLGPERVVAYAGHVLAAIRTTQVPGTSSSYPSCCLVPVSSSASGGPAGEGRSAAVVVRSVARAGVAWAAQADQGISSGIAAPLVRARRRPTTAAPGGTPGEGLSGVGRRGCPVGHRGAARSEDVSPELWPAPLVFRCDLGVIGEVAQGDGIEGERVLHGGAPRLTPAI